MHTPRLPIRLYSTLTVRSPATPCLNNRHSPPGQSPWGTLRMSSSKTRGSRQQFQEAFTRTRRCWLFLPCPVQCSSRESCLTACNGNGKNKQEAQDGFTKPFWNTSAHPPASPSPHTCTQPRGSTCPHKSPACSSPSSSGRYYPLAWCFPQLQLQVRNTTLTDLVVFLNSNFMR